MAKTSKTAKKPAAQPKEKSARPGARAKAAKVAAAPTRRKHVSAPSARAAKPKPVAKPKPRPAPIAKKAVAKPRIAPPKPKSLARPKRPRSTAPPKLDLAEFREKLLIRQAGLQEQLIEVEQRTARSVDSETPSELSGYEDHPADLASETFEREKDLALEENLQDMLNKVHTALEKIEAGTYGVCDVCGQGISKYRMEALPFATLCVDCQSRLESR